MRISFMKSPRDEQNNIVDHVRITSVMQLISQTYFYGWIKEMKPDVMYSRNLARGWTALLRK